MASPVPAAAPSSNEVKVKKPAKSQTTTTATTVSTTNTTRNRSQQLSSQAAQKVKRCPYISTSQLYCSREWEDDDFQCDYEFTKEEANELHAEAPNLEIPKWTEHEICVSYCNEGTEDLRDDVFLKRHAKLEIDEKRRKKWDVQQIREQRRIEKLKRRHCKDELQNSAEQQTLQSFYPSPDAIQTICYVNEIPVLAFGEIIPKLQANEFNLPWLNNCTSSVANGEYCTVTILNQAGVPVTSTQAQHQVQNSSFVFLKKRRRQQSASHTAGTRSRNLSASAKSSANNTQTTTSTSVAILNNSNTENSNAATPSLNPNSSNNPSNAESTNKA